MLRTLLFPPDMLSMGAVWRVKREQNQEQGPPSVPAENLKKNVWLLFWIHFVLENNFLQAAAAWDILLRSSSFCVDLYFIFGK
jgi:hypothetical protein